MIDLPNDSDGDAIRLVIRSGADLSRPMEIDFHVAAATLENAERVGTEAMDHGFRVNVVKDNGREQYTCWCSKSMMLSYEAVVAVQAELSEIAIPFGAYSDGWGTFGNGDE